MNLTKFEFLKSLINHYNQCFTMMLLLEKTHKGLENDIILERFLKHIFT
jgi:hypothetical protein